MVTELVDHLSVESIVMVCQNTSDRPLLIRWLKLVGLPVVVTDAGNVEETLSRRRSSLYLTVGKGEKIIFTQVV